MKKIISVLVCTLFLCALSPIKACDPNCDVFGYFSFVGPATLGTIVLAPAIGALLYEDDPKPPFLKGLVKTALPTLGVYGVGFLVLGPQGESTTFVQVFFALLPIVTSITTTTIFYNKYKSRDGPKNISQAPKINIGLQPINNGGAMTMVMTF